MENMEVATLLKNENSFLHGAYICYHFVFFLGLTDE